MLQLYWWDNCYNIDMLQLYCCDNCYSRILERNINYILPHATPHPAPTVNFSCSHDFHNKILNLHETKQQYKKHQSKVRPFFIS